MQIIESNLRGKQMNQALCEDGLFVNENFVAIIDGVTSKGHQLWNGLTSGNYAKNLICQELSLISPDISAKDLLLRLNNLLLEAYLRDVEKDAIEEWLRACIIIYSEHYKEIWSYGDCQCMINQHHYPNDKKIDAVNSEARSLALNYALLNGSTIPQLQKEDVGREMILPFLKLQLSFENQRTEFGYPVLNGHTLNLEYLKIYQVKHKDTVILASDGYPALMPTLSESESKLCWLIENDPLCFQVYKSTKGLACGNYSFDDRCYCRFVAE